MGIYVARRREIGTTLGDARASGPTEMDKAAGEPKEPIDVHLLAAVMAEQLAGIAWCKLGLQPDPVTGKIEKDLDQAKTAIDLVAYLATVVDPKLDEDDRRRMNGLVRDLRLNYVEKRKEAGDGS